MAHEASQRGTPVSGEALPAHEAGQRGTPVSGEALPAHESGQRGIPVSGKALPAHESGQRGTPQNIVSGIMIDGNDFNFAPVSVFWIAACLLSFLIPVLSWKSLRRR